MPSLPPARIALATLLAACLLASPGAIVWAAPAPYAAPAPAASPQAEAEIQALLRQVLQAVAKKDLNRLTAMLDPQAEVEVRGLGQSRRVAGRQRMRQLYGPEFARNKAPRLDLRDSQVRAQGRVARLEALFTAYITPELPEGVESLGLAAQELPVPGRLSALLEKKGGHWLFQRLVVVLPGGGQ